MNGPTTTRIVRRGLLLAVLAVLVGSTAPLAAQSWVTALKTGEQTTGTTKQCFYAFAGRKYTETVESFRLCPMSIRVRIPTPTPDPVPRPQPRTVTALKTGEQTTGTTKQCYYSFAGKRYTKTVESYQLCPLSIQVRIGGQEARSSGSDS
jgi:hypothetical protein